MSRQIIRQPDGKYAFFAMDEKSFLVQDATVEELTKYIVYIWSCVLEKEIRVITSKLERGEEPYEDAISWEEALELSENT